MSIAFGLVFSTLLVLAVTPVPLSYLERLRGRLGRGAYRAGASAVRRRRD